MNPKEVASRLNENERKVLVALRGGGASSTVALSLSTGLGRDAVEKASAWAETKGVVSFRAEVSRFFKLTDEGQKYSNEGLPEKQLIEAVSGGDNELSHLKGDIPAINIALIWVRSNGWANIKGGKVEPTPEGVQAAKHETVDEKILKRLAHGMVHEGKLGVELAARIPILIKRGLVEVKEETERFVELTSFGIEVLPFVDVIALKPVITQITPEMLQAGSWRDAVVQHYDVSLPVPSLTPGKRHFISQIIDYIRRFWVELGFKEMKGNYLELSFWNFDALYQPQDHPARDLADTFYMKTPYKGRLPEGKLVEQVKATHENGWTTGSTGWQYKWNPDYASRCCLRTHTTSLSVLQLAKLKPEDLPGKFFSVGRVFRNEAIDWNHLAEFYQTDGIVVGEDVTFRDMQGYLKAYLEGLGLKKFRFRPGYFPYTEMSMEAEVWIEEHGGWMELFGAGMFRPEVVKPLIGIDVPVLAWGPGFDRLVMQSYHVNTIKELYGNDIGLLRKAKLWTR
ncbi:MAG: phenylalanine--tRNA ligase subunit alpha [Candidatus Bathyarchaeota archaeon]|nr:phenylalanine--tRNA ligase subunit alpha [Candidatus Bathyarchaeota archaeon]